MTSQELRCMSIYEQIHKKQARTSPQRSLFGTTAHWVLVRQTEGKKVCTFFRWVRQSDLPGKNPRHLSESDARSDTVQDSAVASQFQDSGMFLLCSIEREYHRGKICAVALWRCGVSAVLMQVLLKYQCLVRLDFRSLSTPLEGM